MSARSDNGDETEDEEGWGPANIFVDGVVRVCAEMCPTCIFRPGNLMHLEPGRVEGMVADSLANESVIPCHHTLGEAKQAICRGFYNRYWRRNWLLRLAVHDKIIREVDVDDFS